jgi:hypothetical protein
MAFEPVDTPALAPLPTPPLAPPPLPVAVHPCRIRGIYHDDDEAGFDAVAVFRTATEAQAWYAAHEACTNPRYSSCRHVYTTLADWEQVQTMLLDRLAWVRTVWPVAPPREGVLARNAFADVAAVRGEVTSRLNLPFHATVGEEGTLNTLR